MMDVEYFIYLSHGIVNERFVQIQFTLFVRQFYTNLNATDTSVGVGTDFRLCLDLSDTHWKNIIGK